MKNYPRFIIFKELDEQSNQKLIDFFECFLDSDFKDFSDEDFMDISIYQINDDDLVFIKDFEFVSEFALSFPNDAFTEYHIPELKVGLVFPILLDDDLLEENGDEIERALDEQMKNLKSKLSNLRIPFEFFETK
jgi:hypothetical protein